MGKITNEKRECRRQFMRGNRKNFILTLLTIFGFTVSQMLVAFIFQYITEAMEKLDTGRLKITLIIGVSASLIALTSSYLEKVYLNRYIKQGLLQFKKHIFERIFTQSIGQFGSTSNSTFISAFSNDLNMIEANYLHGSLNIVNQFAMLIGGIVSMAVMNYRLMFCVLLMTTLPVLISLKYGTKIIKKEKQMSEKNEGFVDQVKDLLSGFIIVKSFKAEKEVLRLFDGQNKALEEAKRERRQTSHNVSVISEASSTLVLVGMVCIGTYFVFKQQMTIGAVLGFIQLQNYILGPIRSLVPQWSNRKAAELLIDKMSDSIQKDDDHSVYETIDTINESIKIKNLTFGYEEGKDVLNNVSLSFEKGKSYAIVGSSGSGKSTLLNLLMGHSYDYKGEILFDDKELKALSLDSLYDVISVIQQNVFLFDSSLKDNITMFKEFDESNYKRAIESAGLRDLVMQKGDFYDCGAGGSNLSGGEKQRVSIARCLIRETPVLMMDEATAALDNATAAAVNTAILSIDGLTRIIVTHKLEESNMRLYDEIIVLNNGVIVEKGVFDELMSLKNHFYSLFNVSQQS